MVDLYLYSTSHCHLCDKAETSLVSLTNKYDIRWSTIEITTDDELIEKYGAKIPVIKRVDNDSEISWPFTTQDIVKLLNMAGDL